MKLKAGASLKGVQWQMFSASILLEPLFLKRGADLVITAGTDGKHMKGSLHYKGLALDYRSRQLKKSARDDLLKEGRQVLGPDYDFIEEDDHFHAEHDPK